MKKTFNSFNVDFNWCNGHIASPEMFTGADAAKIVNWYKTMNVDNFWTFGTTYNGYAWYDSKIAPKAVGLKGDFLNETTNLGHEMGMTVYAYVCLGDNPWLISKNPEIARVDEKWFRMPFTDWYLEYFCSVIDEILRVSEVDGIVIDWFRYPKNKRSVWIADEKRLYEQLMGEKFPASDIPTNLLTEFERRSLSNAWHKISRTVHKYENKIIWTNHPFDFIDDPVWQGHVLLKEVDYVLNECPNFDFLKWIQSQVGEHTKVVQNLCGWKGHDLTHLDKIDPEKYGFFGFAEADAETCLPELKTSEINYKNIEIIKKLYAKSSF